MVSPRAFRGIEFGAQRQAAKEIVHLAELMGVYLSQMDTDGADLRTKIGVLAINARTHLDNIEISLAIGIVDEDGEW